MKIADYSLSMQASHSWSQQSSVTEKLHAWVDSQAPPPSNSEQVTISVAGQQQSGDATAIDDAVLAAQNDPRLLLIISMVEKMTGHKVHVFDASKLKPHQAVQIQDPHAAQPQQSHQSPSAGYGLNYSKVTSYSESEQTTMQASGTINTADGKQINFSLNLTMQRQYSETSTTSVLMGDAKKSDPLVINFNGTAAQLSDQRFAFDLNSNGQQEQINAPLSGSGFLALDKNNDGKINNGSELFGPATDNGYSELAKYDSDHNGWIDANDPVFQQLKVWTKGANGSDQLNSLASLGVGAISLNSVATPFDIKTATNQLLGSVKSSSVTINEDGTAGSMQQIDLTA